jgi:hypothetical protein
MVLRRIVFYGLPVGLLILGIALIYVWMGLRGIVFFGIVVGLVILYVVTGMWLNRHGGARRWHVLVMSVVIDAAVGCSVFWVAQPDDLRLIGLGASLGALAGAISGLFIKVPRPEQRHQEAHRRPRR